MSDISLKCVFCGGTTLKKTIKFKLETLKKCINILEYRRSKPVLRKSRKTYDNYELSIESSLNKVYHAQCYKLFTAIKIPPQIQYLQEQSVVERDNASEVSGNSSEIHAVSGECSESRGAVDSLFTEVAGTSTDETSLMESKTEEKDKNYSTSGDNLEHYIQIKQNSNNDQPEMCQSLPYTHTSWQIEIKADSPRTDNIDPLEPTPDAEAPLQEPIEEPKKKGKAKKQKLKSVAQRSSKRVAQSISEELRKRNNKMNLSKVANKDPNAISKRSKKDSETHNEFDIFGKFIATQLKNLTEEDAVLAQSEIQEVLIRYRLNKIKTWYKLPVLGKEVPPSLTSQSEQPFQSSQINVESLILKCEPDSD